MLAQSRVIARGKRIRDVAWPPDCTIAAVIRKGAVITPRGDTLLEAFDEVLAIVRTAQREALAALLGRPSA